MRIKHLKSHYLPELPVIIQNLLEVSDKYRAYLRRRPAPISEDPPMSKITPWPQWCTEGTYKGYDSYYCSMNGRYFSIGLQKRWNTLPPYSVDINEWKVDTNHSSSMFTATLRPGQLPSSNIHWVELEEFLFNRIEDAETKREEIMNDFEVYIMLHTL